MIPIDPNTRKLEMTTEQTGNVIQVPIVLNNEVYMVKQQDIRKIIDTRYISVQKVLNNGQMENSIVPDDRIFEIINLSQAVQQNLVNENCKQYGQQYFQQHQQPNQQLQQQQQQQQQSEICDKIRYLINLETFDKGPALSQFHFSECTSTSDLRKPHKKVKFGNSRDDQNCCCGHCNCSFKCPTLKCKGINTETYSESEDEIEQNALEKLKERKINDDNLY